MKEPRPFFGKAEAVAMLASTPATGAFFVEVHPPPEHRRADPIDLYSAELISAEAVVAFVVAGIVVAIRMMIRGRSNR